MRVGPRASSGLGNLRVISFNTWLIVINVAVFAVNFLLSSPAFQIYTSMGRAWAPDVTKEQWKRAVVIDEVGPDPRNPGWLCKPLVDPARVDPATRLPVLIGHERFVYMGVLESLGHFSTGKTFNGFEVWRFLTFQFLHYNVFHLLFNMLGLWFVGGLVEQHLGAKRYAAFYLTCGIFGAIMYLLLNLLGHIVSVLSNSEPVHIPGLLFNDLYTPLIGASAGVFGVLIAAARLEPLATVWIYFLIPVRLRTAVIVLVLITLFNLFTGSKNAGGEAAHVGGIVAGYYFIRRLYLLRDFFFLGSSRKAPRRPTPGSPEGSKLTRTASPKGGPVREGGSGAAMDAEVERILNKIDDEGIASLTEAERQTLRAFNQA